MDTSLVRWSICIHTLKDGDLMKVEYKLDGCGVVSGNGLVYSRTARPCLSTGRISSSRNGTSKEQLEILQLEQQNNSNENLIKCDNGQERPVIL